MNSAIKDMTSATRFRQWIKNLFLLGAPLGAAVQPSVVHFLLLARGFLAFCFVSSAGYIFNDWLDKNSDSKHSAKKHRPFAAKRLNGLHATFLIISFLLLAFGLTVTLPSLFLDCICIYVISTSSYSWILKKIPVLELLIVTFGFLIRCLAGAALFEVHVSQWFLIVTGFGSLFLISTKRLSERMNYSNNETRFVITSYSEQFLRTIVTVSISITLMAYVLWALEVVGDNIWGKLSILPVLLGVFRYLWHSESNDAEAPERALLSDPLIPFSGFFCAVFLILAIYL